MPVGVGLIGCGGMGRVYATCLAALDDGKLVTVHDVDPARAAAFVADFGCRGAASAAEVIHDPRVDCEIGRASWWVTVYI